MKVKFLNACSASSRWLRNRWASTGFLAPRRTADHVVVDRAAPVGRPPVAERGRRRSLGQRRSGVDGHVARPRLVQPQRAVGEVLVLVGVELEVGGGDELARARSGRRSSCRRVLGVDVGDAVVQQPHRQALVLVVEQPDLAGDLRPLAPQRAPRVGELGRVEAGQLVGPPADPGGVDRVRDRVAAADVVPGVGERRPDVRLEVGDVAQVQRLAAPCRRRAARGTRARERTRRTGRRRWRSWRRPRRSW